MFDEKLIKEKVNCCSCGKNLRKSKINIMLLMKEAKWQYPCWGNALLNIWGFASAVVCDDCVKKHEKVKYAVEWNKNLSIIKYHPIKSLTDVPPELFDPLDELEPPMEGDKKKIPQCFIWVEFYCQEDTL